MERKKIISPPKKKSEKNAGKLNNDTAINDSVSVRPQVHLYSDVWPGNGPLIYRRPLTDRPNWWTAFLFLSSFFFFIQSPRVSINETILFQLDRFLSIDVGDPFRRRVLPKKKSQSSIDRSTTKRSLPDQWFRIRDTDWSPPEPMTSS